jgi:arylformamidase
VIDVRGEGEPPLVPARALSREVLRGVERVLLRTRDRHDHTVFDPTFTALGEAAARAIAQAGVLLVGIDTPSMDHATSKELGAHHILARGKVALLENLDLSAVRPGDYELIALPLRIVGGDSSPVRAVLRELTR